MGTLAGDMKRSIVGTPIVNNPDLQRIDELKEDLSNEWNVTAGVLTYEGRIYVPKDDLVRNEVISLFHDTLQSGHFGGLRTTELLCRAFHWAAMDATIRKYISGRKLCYPIEAPR